MCLLLPSEVLLETGNPSQIEMDFDRIYDNMSLIRTYLFSNIRALIIRFFTIHQLIVFPIYLSLNITD